MLVGVSDLDFSVVCLIVDINSSGILNLKWVLGLLLVRTHSPEGPVGDIVLSDA